MFLLLFPSQLPKNSKTLLLLLIHTISYVCRRISFPATNPFLHRYIKGMNHANHNVYGDA